MSQTSHLRHELRTPLNHIIGYAEMLLEDMESEGRVNHQAALTPLIDGGRHLLSLVNLAALAETADPGASFGDWRRPMLRMYRLVEGLRRALSDNAVWLNDVQRIAEALTQLYDLFEALEAPHSTDEPAPADPPPIQPSPTRRTARACPGDAGHLLVVDDDPANLELMQRRLGREGYRVTASTDGATALRLLEETDFDVILLDLLMPGMNGQEVLRQIRERHSSHELPVIVVTAKHGSVTIVAALEAGANDYITKPLDFPVALARIFTQLYLRRVTRELAEANDRLHRFSYIDGLTGIPNRRHFDEYLEREWQRAARENEPLSLIMLDVDHFKLYNDNYGHEAGDRVLVSVAEALQSALHRPVDLIARYGGEEFAAVLPSTPADGAVPIAERLRQTVAELAIPHGHHPDAVHLTISLGVAGLAPTPSLTPEHLIISADKALYQAKHEGRNRVGIAPADTKSEAQTPARSAP